MCLLSFQVQRTHSTNARAPSEQLCHATWITSSRAMEICRAEQIVEPTMPSHALASSHLKIGCRRVSPHSFALPNQLIQCAGSQQRQFSCSSWDRSISLFEWEVSARICPRCMLQHAQDAGNYLVLQSINVVDIAGLGLVSQDHNFNLTQYRDDWHSNLQPSRKLWTSTLLQLLLRLCKLLSGPVDQYAASVSTSSSGHNLCANFKLR